MRVTVGISNNFFGEAEIDEKNKEQLDEAITGIVQDSSSLSYFRK
jgi:hypothetical protein